MWKRIRHWRHERIRRKRFPWHAQISEEMRRQREQERRDPASTDRLSSRR